MNPDAIRQLMQKLAAEEAQLSNTTFLSPSVRGGRVRTSLQGLIYTFTPQPRDFEGWGIFQPDTPKTAKLVDEATLPQIANYLNLFPAFRLWLVRRLQQQTWLAYPVNEGDMRQRVGAVRPVPVHLVGDGVEFDPIIVRWDGRHWWFEDGDRRADPQLVDQLRAALKKTTLPAELQFKGLTPEMRTTYDLVAQHAKNFQAHQQARRDQNRLQKALAMGGGELEEVRDRTDHWLVQWTTADGTRHSSAIDKQDLTVMSAGICLSGRDQDFDLQSLVGVVEGRDQVDW